MYFLNICWKHLFSIHINIYIHWMVFFTFFINHKGCIISMKVTVKAFTMLGNICISSKCCSLELCSWKNSAKLCHHFIKALSSTIFSTLIIIRNVSGAPNHDIRKFSFAINEINYILKYIKIGNSDFSIVIWPFYCIFDQINATLVNISLSSKYKKTYIHFYIYFWKLVLLKYISIKS